MKPQQAKENAKDAVAFSTVSIPPANSVEIVNPTRSPEDCICDWCRNSVADIFCDTKPMCFDCLEKLTGREEALGLAEKLGGRMAAINMRDNFPPLWEK